MKVTSFFVCCPKIAEFDGFKIAQVSDLHNRDFYGALLGKISAKNVDIIVITGDIIDQEKSVEAALKFCKEAAKVAPVYYVSGNHESVLAGFGAFCDKIKGYGVTILDNECVVLQRGETAINVLGLSDPSFFSGGKKAFKQELAQQMALADANNYTILLTHRPELFDDYAAAKVDLALVGHAHGGQVRAPIIGALYAPNQGLFPKYTSGIHKKGDTIMIISKGLGSSTIMPRVFNPPELVIVTLSSIRKCE